jgi:hypothetical protein
MRPILARTLTIVRRRILSVNSATPAEYSRPVAAVIYAEGSAKLISHVS